VRAADAGNPGLKDFWRFKVTVTPENDPPVASDFTVAADEGAATNIDVLAHVTDKDPGTTLTVTGFDAAGLLNGTLTQQGNTLVYTHDGSETTTGGTFTYTVSDGEATDTGTVTVTVNPVDDPAVAGDDAATVTEAGSVVIAVLANDTDVDSPTLTPVIITQPRDGTVTVNPDGTITYKHRGSERRTDSFTYAAKGSTNQSPPATVTITVLPVPGTAGLVDPATGQWFLRNNAGRVTSFFFGNPGDVPFMGDWNCDGIDTPGLYRRSDGFVYLRNSNTQGVADVTFFFGNPGDLPLAGDFNGDGCDTVSIYRPAEGRIFVINALGQNGGGLGTADFDFFFGNPGDKPYVGDFNGDGIDTVGLHRESTGFAYLRQSNSQGVADVSFFFGDPGDRIVAGDWNNDGVDTVAIYRPSTATYYFRYSNSQGNADLALPFGEGSFLPVAGEFGLG
jgi:hypothetical protein